MQHMQNAPTVLVHRQPAPSPVHRRDGSPLRATGLGPGSVRAPSAAQALRINMAPTPLVPSPAPVDFRFMQVLTAPAAPSYVGAPFTTMMPSRVIQHPPMAGRPTTDARFSQQAYAPSFPPPINQDILITSRRQVELADRSERHSFRIAALERQSAVAEKQAAAKQNERSAVADDLRGALQEKTDALLSTQAALDHKEAQLRNANQEAARLQQGQSKVTSEHQASEQRLQEKIATLQATVRKYEESIRSLQDQCADSRRRYAALEQEKLRQEEDYNEILNDFDSKNKNLDRELAQEKENRNPEAIKARKSEENSKLREELNRVSLQLRITEAQVSGLHHKLQDKLEQTSRTATGIRGGR